MSILDLSPELQTTLMKLHALADAGGWIATDDPLPLREDDFPNLIALHRLGCIEATEGKIRVKGGRS